MHAHKHVLAEVIGGAGGKPFFSNSQTAAIKHGRTRPKRCRAHDKDKLPDASEAVADERPYDERPDAPLAVADTSPDAPVHASQEPWLLVGADPMHVATMFREPVFKVLPRNVAWKPKIEPTYHCCAAAAGNPRYMKKSR
jgi:hypothetical protein